MNLSTDADCRTDTILESLRDLSRRRKKFKKKKVVDASTCPRIHASARTHDGSTQGVMDALHPPPVLGLHACNKKDAWAMDSQHQPLIFKAPRV